MPAGTSATAQPRRLAQGGAIDRNQPLVFTFEGRRLTGYRGDTLASALLANDIRVVGRSFKYHRPRGVLSAGAEEPNALLHVGDEEAGAPNTVATMLPLSEGLAAQAQHCWPSLRFDLMRVNEWFSPMLTAGFYYKTFMWPPKFWRVYEHFIRRAAGLGRATLREDAQRYEHRHGFCDLLVIGAGPAGLAATLAAARAGLRVILIDEHPAPGGRLRFDRVTIDGAPGMTWVDRTMAELAACPEVTVLSRTTGFGRFDHGVVAAVERVDQTNITADVRRAAERTWLIRARATLLASGAIEQPLVFADNDRPGVMLAGAARAYVNAYAVQPGRRAVIFTTGDDAYRTALDLHAVGTAIVLIVDARNEASGDLPAAARRLGIEVLTGSAVLGTQGSPHLRSVSVGPLARPDRARRIECDLLCVGGGWSPALHLTSHLGGRPRFDETLQAFIPAAGDASLRCIGAVNGSFLLQDCLREGTQAGSLVASELGKPAGEYMQIPSSADWACTAAASSRVFGAGARRFVDLQGDVTVEDLELSAREGMVSVEHAKRYTTLGMWTDQGKTSNLAGLSVLAAATGRTLPATGLTTFRPPYVPVAIGALAGRTIGQHFRPTRRSAAHARHVAAGALFVDAGLWVRPRAYPVNDESLAQACAREVKTVRDGVGVVDVSTLGKIDLQGPDVVELLERVYVNGWRTLQVGRARYGLMLRDDGIAFDDGTVARLDEQHFLMTTTTANAAAVLTHLEYLLQTQWRDLRVDVSSATEHWAVYAVAGPRSRELLSAASGTIDFSGAAFPYLGVRCGRLADLPVRAARISYSGELAYEIHVPADRGALLWDRLLQVGRQWGVIPYGTEAMGTMRIEKGHVAGPELDGRTTAIDLGLGAMMSKTKTFVGKRMAQRPGLLDPARPSLVGLRPLDGHTPLRSGAQLLGQERFAAHAHRLGHVSSTATSPSLRHPIALGFLTGGRGRIGETVYAHFPLAGQVVPAVVCDPVFIDPEGLRVKG